MTNRHRLVFLRILWNLAPIFEPNERLAFLLLKNRVVSAIMLLSHNYEQDSFQHHLHFLLILDVRQGDQIRLF
jgi:hypothetical protein